MTPRPPIVPQRTNCTVEVANQIFRIAWVAQVVAHIVEHARYEALSRRQQLHFASEFWLAGGMRGDIQATCNAKSSSSLADLQVQMYMRPRQPVVPNVSPP